MIKESDCEKIKKFLHVLLQWLLQLINTFL